MLKFVHNQKGGASVGLLVHMDSALSLYISSAVNAEKAQKTPPYCRQTAQKRKERQENEY